MQTLTQAAGRRGDAERDEVCVLFRCGVVGVL